MRLLPKLLVLPKLSARSNRLQITPSCSLLVYAEDALLRNLEVALSIEVSFAASKSSRADPGYP
jgi:hypothetical protein